jgi:SAM-dependent methyltransferase
MLPIVDGYLERIERGTRVLDIGCGTWDRIRRHCEKVGAVYEGIDVLAEYFGKPTVATRLENLAELSFDDESFDLVVGNQTMEHWAEYGCSLRWGLHQAFRVCRRGGLVGLNVPIHFHGTRSFMLGRLDRIASAFAEFSADVRMTRWGAPSDPLPPCTPYPGYRRLASRPAYVLDIVARKDRDAPRDVGRGFALSGRLAQLVEYPLSFNGYRVARRMGLAGK